LSLDEKRKKRVIGFGIADAVDSRGGRELELSEEELSEGMQAFVEDRDPSLGGEGKNDRVREALRGKVKETIERKGSPHRYRGSTREKDLRAIPMVREALR